MIKIRPMKLDDMKLALQWAANEGWNPGQNDALAYFKADFNGCFMLEQSKEPIAAITAISYAKDFAFIGLFIVHPHFRKKGYGQMLWQHAMRHLQSCSSIGLYAVSAQVPSYTLSGFKSSFKNFRWSGMAKKSLKNDEFNIDFVNNRSSGSLKMSDRPERYTEEMALYEQSIFKVKRKSFLKSLIKMPGTNCIIAFNNSSSIINGFIIVRPCINNGYRIGPLYANDVETAEKLIDQAINKIGYEQTVFMDSPEFNPFITKLAQILDLKHIDKNDTFAMYKGLAPDIKTNNIYAVTSLELS